MMKTKTKLKLKINQNENHTGPGTFTGQRRIVGHGLVSLGPVLLVYVSSHCCVGLLCVSWLQLVPVM